ncbi:MAG: hypothetical protein OEV00_13470 [Acidobacteriota bacterium]|nr:hypothetical protein [Acidobacteriota bacterium]MDH3786320.1 hypothetical protein [Acidobacteriota bacterium]
MRLIARNILRGVTLMTVVVMTWGLNAHADALSFSFGEIQFVDTELDDIDVDGDGFALKLSGEFSQRIFGFAEYAEIGLDGGADLDTLEFGVGYGQELNLNTDLFGTVARVKVDVDTGPASSDESSYALGFGIRSLLLKQRLELGARLDYRDLDDGDTRVVLSALFNMTRRWSLGLEADAGNDETTVGVGLRYYFNQ